MDNNLRKIVLELISEAKNGKVVIKTNKNQSEEAPWIFYTKFFTKLEHKSNAKENEDVPVLEIPNFARFLEEIEEYVNVASKFYSAEKNYLDIEDDYQFAKKLILDLLVNCSVEDFCNLEKYIENRINMIKESAKLVNSLGLDNRQMFSKYLLNANNRTDCDVFLGDLNTINNSVLMLADIYKTNSSIEAPLVFLPYLKNNQNEKFYLPGVLFGLNKSAQGKKNVYIGAIQNFTTKQEDKFSKNMDRFLRKVNSGVPDDSIESNVSPKALVSMVIFMEYACSLGAEYASAYNYLPLRYSSKLGVINAKAKNVNNGEVQSEKTTNGEDNSEIKLITEDRNNADVCQTFFDKLDADQYNITNKFMYLFARINHHFSSAKTEFSEIGCKINLNLENSEERNDNIIYNILNSAKKSHMEK